MKIEMWEIYVPACIPNASKKYRISHHKQWDEFVVSITGGLTIMKSAKGVWINSIGKKINEKMIPCRIACTEEQMHKIVDFTIKHYDQEAVLAYQISEKTIFKTR